MYSFNIIAPITIGFSEQKLRLEIDFLNGTIQGIAIENDNGNYSSAGMIYYHNAEMEFIIVF